MSRSNRGKPSAKCGYCGERLARSRGLCYACHADPEIREKFPVVRGKPMVDADAENLPPARSPTMLLDRESLTKVMRYRYESGTEVFHEDDLFLQSPGHVNCLVDSLRIAPLRAEP